MPVGVPHHDSKLHKIHFYDPDRPEAGAVCKRDAFSTVYANLVTCGDCLQYICNNLDYFMERTEEVLAALIVMEDDCTPSP